MQSNKNNWITLLTLLLVFLQPILSHGNVFNNPGEIINTQEEIALFKTKGTKALVFKEITITSVELVVPGQFDGRNLIYPIFSSSKIAVCRLTSIYLIDFRGILKTQIFPFHFFL